MTDSDPSVIGIVVSHSDRVAERIRDQLLDLADWESHVDESRPTADGGGEYHRTRGAIVRTIDTAHLHLEDAQTVFDADVDRIVFPSRHAGATGALLTTHFTGNVGSADHGGADRELARAAPGAGKRALRALDRHAPAEYEVSLECTHHGPSSVGVPSLYVELGSGDPQWSDTDAARAVARAVLACRDDPTRGAIDPHQRALPGHRLVGFGGGHYAPRFTRIACETSWAVGHVVAEWGLEEWDEPDRDVIEQVFEHSAATIAVVDGDRPELEAAITERGYRTVTETWVRAVSGVDLDLVAACEDRLCTVDTGLRFGTPARERTFEALDRSPSTPDGEPAVVSLASEAELEQLPGELLEEATGVDLERTHGAVSEHALAYETREAGNRPVGAVLLESPAALRPLIDALADVLGAKYDRVERTTDAIVAERSVFDPERAATLGVPEGPAFGRLAAGEPVTVDGREIDPGVVASTERRQFPL